MKSVLFILMPFFLSGCANFMDTAFYQLGYQHIARDNIINCDSSSMLITNLEKKVSQRHYLLPDGRACVLKSNKENDDLEAENDEAI